MTTAPELGTEALVKTKASGLYRDAAALASSSMLTALMGLVFWAVCARTISPDKLGIQTALLSIIVAPAIVVASGVGDAFTAVIPASGRDRPEVVRHGYRLVVGMATVFGLVAAVVSVTVLPQVRGSVYVAALVFVGVLVWSLFVVQDPALTSMRRAHWLPIENGSVSVGKIALVPVALAIGIGKPVLIATLLPSVVAIGVLYPRVRRLSRSAEFLREVSTGVDAGELSRLVRRTTTSVALSLGTLTLTPFVVTAAAGPTQGAVFSLCLSLTQSLDFVSTALGVSLVVHASGNLGSAAMARSVFKRAAMVVGVAAAGLILISPFLLRFLNPSYLHLHGVGVIVILAAGSFGRIPYVIWAALQRSRRNMKAVIVLNSVAAVSVFATIVPAARAWGAVGSAFALAGAQLVLSLGAGVHLLAQRQNTASVPSELAALSASLVLPMADLTAVGPPLAVATTAVAEVAQLPTRIRGQDGRHSVRRFRREAKTP